MIHTEMGRNLHRIGLANALFSKVQQRVLALLFGSPDRSFHASDIVRRVGSGVGAVSRELSRLQSSGLVTVESVGNQKHYRANKASPIFQELHGLVEKTVGMAGPLKRSFAPYAADIQGAFIFGSSATGSDTATSDIDVMVVGDDLNYSDLYSAAQQAENTLQRPVRALFMSSDDWIRRATDEGSVINKISHSPKIFFIGSEQDLHHGQA